MIDKIANPAAAAAANAYASTSKAIDTPSIGAPQKESFGDLIKNAAINSIKTLRAGEAASAKAITGEANLADVVQAITASEVTLQTVMAVRDRMVGAYQEIMRMPV